MSKKNLNRRRFLKTALAGSAAVAVGGQMSRALAVPSAPRVSGELGAPATGEPAVPLSLLGKTGERIPRLVLGTAMDFDMRLVKQAYEAGVTYFDTADCYGGGNSEITIGRFLERTGLRKKVWLTTKSDSHDAPGMLKRLQTSFGRLKTDHVDLLMLHNLSDLPSLNKVMKATADRLKKEGKIRFFGFSTHSPNVSEALAHAAKLGWIDVIMFKYNFRSYGDLELNKAIDAAKKANIGLIAMKTQGSAFSFQSKVDAFKAKGFTQHQAALKATWEDDRIDAAVSEMKNVQQLEQNVKAARDLTRLGSLQLRQLLQYAEATSDSYCQGCNHICSAALDRPAAIADTLRMLMYHDEYGELSRARRLYKELPEALRTFDGLDLDAASKACPHSLDVAGLVGRAKKVLG